MWKLTLLLCIFIGSCVCSSIRQIEDEEPSSLNIVGIFEPSAQLQMNAFEECMDSNGYLNLQLKPVLFQPQVTDSYSILRELCLNEKMETIAVLGPHGSISDRAILNYCSKLHIPYLQATWQPYDPDIEEDIASQELGSDEENEDDDGEIKKDSFRNITINFYPDANEIAIAYADVLKLYNWENFIVLYEDDDGLSRVQKIVSNYSTQFLIVFRRLDAGKENYEIFKEISAMQQSRIILDCHVDNIVMYLEVAQKLNLVNSYQHYILTSMDTSIVADDLARHLSNFSWLSITTHETLVSTQGTGLTSRVEKWSVNKNEHRSVVQNPTNALIMDDVAKHMLKAFKELKTKEEDLKDGDQGVLCSESDDQWEYGAAFQQQILQTKSAGITGNITFDNYGRRKDYTLYLNEIHQKQLHTIASWKSDVQEFVSDKKAIEIQSTQNNSHQFIVMSRVVEPYFVQKDCYEDGQRTEACGDDDDDIPYKGFSVDLVKSIFDVLHDDFPNFTFKFQFDRNISYGKYDKLQKKWDGLIGKLLDKKADLVVCDLTMTEARKKLVDFSVPIMTLGISILFKKDTKVPPDTLSFLKPYSVEMWMYTATAYCIVSIVLFVCSRISPDDWENPQPCDKEPEELENIWNFKNSTWLTMGSIMTQGCDILPKAFGSRWVCAMWWFFAMIVCQTYIAQLAASMTTAMENAPIDGVEDLAKQTKVLYGAYEAGSTLDFFKNSKDKMYRKIYDKMVATPGVLVESNEVGEKRVLASKNKYAFFMESATIEYKMKRNCELRKVGGELDSKDYGIAMPANSPFRSTINTAILKLKENNKLNEIKEKWWNKEFGAITCDDTKDVNDVEGDLEMENLIGAFLVLIGGLFISLLITAAEFMNEVRNIVVREQRAYEDKSRALPNVTVNRLRIGRNASSGIFPASSNIPGYPVRSAARNIPCGDIFTYLATKTILITFRRQRKEVLAYLLTRFEQKVTSKEVFMKELKASLNLFQLQKPIIRNPSRAPSAASRTSSQRSLKSNKSKVRAQFASNFLEFEKGQQG